MWPTTEDKMTPEEAAAYFRSAIREQIKLQEEERARAEAYTRTHSSAAMSSCGCGCGDKSTHDENTVLEGVILESGDWVYDHDLYTS